MMSVMGLCQWSGAEWMMNPDMATQILVSTMLGPLYWVMVSSSFFLSPSYWSTGNSGQQRDTWQITAQYLPISTNQRSAYLGRQTACTKELDLVLLILVYQVPAEVPGLGRQLSQSQPLVSLLQLVWCRCGLVELKQELIIKVMMFMMMMIMLGMIISV